MCTNQFHKLVNMVQSKNLDLSIFLFLQALGSDAQPCLRLGWRRDRSCAAPNAESRTEKAGKMGNNR